MPTEIKALVGNLSIRERTLVLLAVSTGLRQSELFGLKWATSTLPKEIWANTAAILSNLEDIGSLWVRVAGTKSQTHHAVNILS
jgi:hypothetical protein